MKFLLALNQRLSSMKSYLDSFVHSQTFILLMISVKKMYMGMLVLEKVEYRSVSLVGSCECH